MEFIDGCCLMDTTLLEGKGRIGIIFMKSKKIGLDSKDQFEIECLRLLSDGSGIGYKEGIATFVSGMLPGETGLVEVIEAKKKWQRARLLSFIRSSDDRVVPPCHVFEECGGCQLQHLDYSETLKWKQHWVEDVILRIGKIKSEVRPTIGMTAPWRYRNKSRLHRDNAGRLGYFKEKSKVLVHFQDCLLLSERMNQWIRKTEELLKVTKGFDDLHTLTFRENPSQEGLLLLEGGTFQSLSAEMENNKELIANLMKEGIRSIWWTDWKGGLKLLGGDDTFHHTILGVRFKVSPLSFLQVNSIQTEILYDLVRSKAKLTGKENVWDLYTGIGTLALCIAPKAKKVSGIEENPFAIQDALTNAASQKNPSDVKFFVGKVEDLMTKIEEQPDVVVIDPPRAGLHPDVIKSLLEVNPKRIVYVSCDPGTLARDLGALTVGNYVVESIQPVDMFPWTQHVETVTSLELSTR
jgi:23S rRNA (uracil1939-C5)-methyltransferase